MHNGLPSPDEDKMAQLEYIFQFHCDVKNHLVKDLTICFTKCTRPTRKTVKSILNDHCIISLKCIQLYEFVYIA